MIIFSFDVCRAKIGSCWLDKTIRIGFVVKSCSFKLYMTFQGDTNHIGTSSTLYLLFYFSRFLCMLSTLYCHVTCLHGESSDTLIANDHTLQNYWGRMVTGLHFTVLMCDFDFFYTFKYLLQRTSKNSDSFTSLFASPFPAFC